MRFLLPPLLALLLGVLAYQLPSRSTIDVGGLGDRLFVAASEAQRAEQIAQGEWYADQLSPEGRARWSRERAALTLPGVGQGRAVALTLAVAGWPADVARADPKQPTVRVLVDDQVVGSFTPTSDVASYTIEVPASAQTGGDLHAVLEVSSTFTNTASVVDGRPKGIRLDAITIRSGGVGTQPAWTVLATLMLATLAATGIAERWTRRAWLAIVVGAAAAAAGTAALILGRIWLAALLPGILAALALVLLFAARRQVAHGLRVLRFRLSDGRAVDAGLVVGVVLVCGYVLARALMLQAPPSIPLSDPNGPERFFQILVRLSTGGAIVLALVLSVTLLPRWLLALRRALLTTKLAASLLGLAAGVWIGYESWLIWSVPIVGHADYADNAVVARNLVRGRGWVVDYVTQFYTILPGGGVTRPQETWPLLQPLIMAPFMAVFGATPFAARLPNIGFMIALTLLIFHIGARVWDRRVGLLAALLTLANLLFFRLALFATSDLALVVWSMAAFWLVFRGVEAQSGEQRTKNKEHRGRTSELPRSSMFYVLRSMFSSSWFWAGLFTGLMVLQKPSAAIFAFGMGLWVLARTWRATVGGSGLERGQRWLQQWLPSLALWLGITLVLLAPYLIRNLREFGRPFFSTEAYDAWVIYFRGVGGNAWEDIYKVYDTSLGGPGTPDRSWILRWGYDLTLGKLAQQARDAWAFFAPPKGQLLSWDGDGIALTWLMLVGLVTLRQRQRALVALVAAALVPYTLFLIGYWHTHDEPRYFVPFVPWLALLAAWGTCWVFDRVAATARGRWTGFAGLALSLALVSGLAPHYREISAELDPTNRSYWGVEWQADLEAFRWLGQSTPADSVIMTRVPWQLNFYTDRPAVMVPNADYATIMRIARHYNAQYLVLGLLSTSQAQREGGAFAALAQGTPLPGWCPPVYDRSYSYAENLGRRVLVYRVPQHDTGAADCGGAPQ